MRVTLIRLKQFLRDLPVVRPLRLAALSRKALTGAHQDWWKLGEDIEAVEPNSQGSEAPRPKILFATGVGLQFAATRLDGLLAVALKLRGAEVEELLCDKFLPACMALDLSWEPDLKAFAGRGVKRDLCDACYPMAAASFGPLDVTVNALSAFLDQQDRNELDNLSRTIPREALSDHTVRGINVGEHAMAGALRFFGRGSLDFDRLPRAEGVVRTYFRAALYAEAAFGSMLRKKQFDVVVLHHGIYVPQGVLADVARREEVRVVTWSTAYREKCFIFSHDDTYHHTMINEPDSHWEDMQLSADQVAEIEAYLADRWVGAQDWISFQRDPVFDAKRLDQEFGLDPERPRIGLLTNVTWDARLHYPENVFASMEEWLIETIRYFGTRSELQLIIRVHPAEIMAEYPTREPVIEVIREAIPSLPANVKIVPPDNTASTYTLMEGCNAVIIFGTKTGLELAAKGIPVIAAGEAWIRNKGLSLDPKNKEEYFDLLNCLPFAGDSRKVDRGRALRYAYHFFFKRMIPIQCVEPIKGFPPYRIAHVTATDLEPGRDAGLDVICDGILSARPFIYPADSLSAGAKTPEATCPPSGS